MEEGHGNGDEESYEVQYHPRITRKVDIFNMKGGPMDKVNFADQVIQEEQKEDDEELDGEDTQQL